MLKMFKQLFCVTMQYKLLLVPFFVLNYGFLFAQNMERCAADESYERIIQKYPEYQNTKEQLEEKIQTFLLQKEVIDGIITIPVVYHVIHDGDAIGSGENIFDTYLQAQLDQMTDDFRRMNSDAGNTPADFTGVAADTEIEFCLTTIDPLGGPTSGINRINISTLPDVDLADCWDDDYIDANIKIPTIWNSANYLNVWILEKIQRSADCANTILGYAQFPGLPANTDGIVLRSTTVGSLATPNPAGGVYSYGRTGTHEVGHYLNLIHIWGSSCSNDDSVADTPNAGGPNYTGTPCTYPGPNSCGAGTSGDLPDMFQNYMDYSDDQCMNLFTTGQKSRMVAAINTSRAGLLTAPCNASTCEDNLVISGTLGGTYEANQTITTSGTTTVPSLENVELRAEEKISLGSGFSTIYGGGLYVAYGTCSPAFSNNVILDEPDIESLRNEVAKPAANSNNDLTDAEIQLLRFPPAPILSKAVDDPEQIKEQIRRDRKQN